MVILRSHRFRIFAVATVLFLLPILTTISTLKSATAVDYCTSAKCKEALAAEQAAATAAANAMGAASSAEEEVARLQTENRALQATINKNIAIAEDLKAEIELNQNKLDQQQSALASLLVDMHFETNTSTLMILASSETISDLAERQTRKDTAKTQVALASQKIRDLKENLEAQKSQIEAIISQQKQRQAQISANESRQQELLRKYRNDAKAYAADAEKARQIKEQEIAAEVARLNSSGSAAAALGVDTYPWRNNCPQDNLKYGTGKGGGSWGYVCQCVSYAGWKAYEHWHVYIYGWGNAKNWDKAARAAGHRVDKNPAPYTIAVSNSGTWGHAMWVESVNANGTINLSEYNNSYSSASHAKGDYGYRINVSTAGLYFIHFN